MGQIYTDPNGTYSVVIPDEWEYVAVSHSIAFYNPNGFGALNVSSMRSPKGVPADPELVIRDFVPKHVLEGGSLRILHQAPPDEKMSVAYTAYLADDDAWRVWVTAHSDRVVTASYNCKMVSKGKEDAIVDDIIKSMML